MFNKSFFLSTIHALIISLIFTLFFVCVFALFIGIFNIPNQAIKPINQLIKILSVFIGCFCSISGEKGLLKGILIGTIITLVTFILFAIISKTNLFTLSILWEILLGATVGGLSGIISVNVKNKN
ncbi:MAG: TIGR04086 family membrane protein [Clostridia bacterium]|nr:TIGR04086 family membrane protein [Clostridia bacterium]